MTRQIRRLNSLDMYTRLNVFDVLVYTIVAKSKHVPGALWPVERGIEVFQAPLPLYGKLIQPRPTNTHRKHKGLGQTT